MKAKTLNSSQPKGVRRRPGARPGRGTLVAIAALLLGSAVLRLGNDAGQAFAKQSLLGPGDEKTHHLSGQAPTQCAPTPEFTVLLGAFQAREKRLQERETHINTRMQALSVADKEISQRLAELTEAETELRATLALADSAAENDIGRLIAVYENMKPKDAAALFGEMDPEFSAGFLGRMRPEAAASIMSGLDPQTAYSISAILAGRNADVPKD